MPARGRLFPVAAGEYGFRLQVSDGSHLVSATANLVAVDPSDAAPSADAGLELRFTTPATDGVPSSDTTYPDPLEPSRLRPWRSQPADQQALLG
ncbi:MAG: hypothetical protein HY814_05525 [Candidatus Riflebacteria bacterium]|nr:hypothetical protein [Candidatus Riflebacteria bacterium]